MSKLKITPGPWAVKMEQDRHIPPGLYKGTVKRCNIEIPAGRPKINLGYRVEYTERWSGGDNGEYIPYDGFNGNSVEEFEESVANARAISAVPEMIEALEQLLVDLEKASPETRREVNYNQIQDALKKARGGK